MSIPFFIGDLPKSRVPGKSWLGKGPLPDAGLQLQANGALDWVADVGKRRGSGKAGFKGGARKAVCF